MRLPEYIDVIVAPYALHKALQALTNNGVTEIAVTMEDYDLHLRYRNKDYNLREVPVMLCAKHKEQQ